MLQHYAARLIIPRLTIYKLMPVFAFPSRYRSFRGEDPLISPAALTPPDDGVPPALDPNAVNQQPPALAPEPQPIPKPATVLPNNGTAASAALRPKLEALNPDNGGGSKAFSGLKRLTNGASMPPPGAPIVLPKGGPPSDPQPPVDQPPADAAPPSSPTAQVAALKASPLGQVATTPPTSNWAQRIGQAILSMTKLAPAASQIIHPKWTAQRAAYEQALGDIATTGKIQEQEENTEALALQRREKAGQLKTQADPHYNKQQIPEAYAKENVPWLMPDAKGEYWVDKSIANTLTKPEKAEKPIVVPAGSTVVDDTGKVLFTAPAKDDTPKNDFDKVWLPAFAKKRGKAPDTLTPDETMQAYREFKQDPAVTASMMESRELANAVRQMQLNQQPTTEWADLVAQDIIAHRLAPDQMSQMIGGFGPAAQTAKRMIYAEAKKIDPNFDFEQASADYNFSKSPAFQNTVRMMDSATNSLSRVQNAANILANGKVRSINALLNAGRNQINSVDLKRFQTDALLVGDEIAKVLQGGGTGSGTSDAKLRQASDIFKSSDDPAVIKTAIDEVQNILGYRRRAVTRGTYMERVPAMEQGGGKPAGVETWIRKDGKLVKQ